MFTDTFCRRRFMQLGFGSLGGLALSQLSALQGKPRHHQPKDDFNRAVRQSNRLHSERPSMLHNGAA